MTLAVRHLSPDQLQAFQERGYLVVPGLISPPEVRHLIETFMAIHAAGPVPPYFNPVPMERSEGDVLKAYPRIMHPHRFNAVARRYLLDPRLAALLRDLFGEEPLAAQSMLYFKPPGARGQALHQDNFYLRVEPGTCIAAWIPLDAADAGNGGLKVAPGSHRMDIVCPEEADPQTSFTRDYVPLPPGLDAVPLTLSPGDVLFFNGSLVHGSEPNRSPDRFRRAFICHYIGRSAERMSTWYRPILTMQGEEVTMAANTGGGPCGTEEAAGPH
ncbi:MAG: phytanoyl-CoA dioxygenase family protein [Candidatus Dormibacteraeota bacterium]|nr:phytanoyl-CoA dioxygenase family protein [Candidatus Dormibacteraeota bacterium]